MNASQSRHSRTPIGISSSMMLSFLGSLVVFATTLIAGPLGSGLQSDSQHKSHAALKLPAPSDVKPADLKTFRLSHPRLPAPTSSDHQLLLKANPAFLKQARYRASGSPGDLTSAILLAKLDADSQNLDMLRDRLLALNFSGRGTEQVMPLALAYDWLYDLWSPDDRQALLHKTLEGCEFQIKAIREQSLSPYNVILYNSHLQSLMACAIATYRDDPRADPVMNFTVDLWKTRVLPVWRQVMGTNGGWHEGGEYVGIGIGQVIHQVPAMWRNATGEDLFATEPGIRGFLDFLVYRTRPDGTHFRWGDGAFFDRIIPDATPLALEFRDSAAYSLRSPGKGIFPVGRPWGPMTDPTLHDPSAVERLPLTRFFDGIGMLVARSDWTPGATYVTFKAGDNFWSHTHLDQGAFTIYKGGELAIDSGFYGPKYGSDHHLNYSYQTVAHNTITVTDPNDVTPAPGKDKPRPIANDGGQRRIGSGWGVEAAPIDLLEWEAKREIYRSARVDRLLDQDGLAVAVADITPAYTNRESGNGTFSHRTRRVERFWRTFAYDRMDDVVIVFDQVTATKASFRKRWLLHSIEEPQLSADGFSVSMPAQGRPGRAGGRLEAKVLLPEGASINAIGGRGLEFFVDDKNYDENGTLSEIIKKRGGAGPEPGSWRVEVSPSRDARDDAFLVVLLPSVSGVAPPHRVRLLKSDSRIGCEIVGPKRTTQWWFTQGENGAEIKVIVGAQNQSYQVIAQPEPAALPTTQPQRNPQGRAAGR